MKNISKETYCSVHDFICQLNEEQHLSFLTRMNEKQPLFAPYIHSFVTEDVSQHGLASINFMTVFIIRCFDYEYGDLHEITIEMLEEYDKRASAWIARERKLTNIVKITKACERNAGQRDIIEFIHVMIDGIGDLKSPFNDKERQSVKLAIYNIIIMLNEQVEKMNVEE